MIRSARIIWIVQLTRCLLSCRQFLDFSCYLLFLHFLESLVFIALRFFTVGYFCFGLGLDLPSCLLQLSLLSFLLMELAPLGMAFVTTLIVCFINSLHSTKLYIVIVRILSIGLMYVCLAMEMFCRNLI